MVINNQMLMEHSFRTKETVRLSNKEVTQNMSLVRNIWLSK